MKKAILWFFPVLLFLFCSCGPQNDHLDKAEIFTLVQENETMLLDCAATENYDRAAALAGIDAIDPHPEYVDFRCGGKGISVSATYYGFYYSPNNQPLDYMSFANGADLVPDGNGWSCTEPDGADRYYTEKICDYFYYYESSC